MNFDRIEESADKRRALREFYDFAAKLDAIGSRREVIADLFDGVGQSGDLTALNGASNIFAASIGRHPR